MSKRLRPTERVAADGSDGGNRQDFANWVISSTAGEAAIARDIKDSACDDGAQIDSAIEFTVVGRECPLRSRSRLLLTNKKVEASGAEGNNCHRLTLAAVLTRKQCRPPWLKKKRVPQEAGRNRHFTIEWREA